jgi:hypothetical protein
MLCSGTTCNLKHEHNTVARLSTSEYVKSLDSRLRGNDELLWFNWLLSALTVSRRRREHARVDAKFPQRTLVF